ncbi:hypothetical protein OKW42_003464 [Paraburkholderia sp. WC7.3d]
MRRYTDTLMTLVAQVEHPVYVAPFCISHSFNL